MKHRFVNKKTGVEARVIAMYLNSDGVMQVDGYDAVEDLMDDYAAYEKCEPSKEPLIKDEKIRKAVRAWAEAFNVDVAYLAPIGDGSKFVELFNEDSDGFERIAIPAENIKQEQCYTIAELCGEEEE